MNYTRKVLYVGVTVDLIRRVYEHNNDLADSFTRRYCIHDLVYYELFCDPNSAIEREKQIKSWPRRKKDDMIKQFNPQLRDLYYTISQ